MSHKTLCGAVQAKFWGETQCIFSSEKSEVHYIRIKKGGFCSRHKHNHKWNRFFLISGRLRITIYKEQGEDITILEPGMYTDIPPGVFHRFEAIEDSLCNEVYWVDDIIISEDITRSDVGGLKK